MMSLEVALLGKPYISSPKQRQNTGSSFEDFKLASADT